MIQVTVGVYGFSVGVVVVAKVMPLIVTVRQMRSSVRRTPPVSRTLTLMPR